MISKDAENNTGTEINQCPARVIAEKRQRNKAINSVNSATIVKQMYVVSTQS